MRYVHERFSTRCVTAAAALAAAVLLSGGCGKHEEAKPPAAPVEVVAMVATPRDVPYSIPFVAQVQSSHQVDVLTRVSGFLEKIVYKEGELVREGQVLFLIDRKPFQAQVDAAKAEVESRKAQLWTAKANLDRVRPLAEQNAASKSDLDNATGAYQAAEAGLSEAKARLQKAELDLGYTTIKAPVAGMTGQALVREGAYVAAGSANSKLTYVARLDPAWVEFSVSQNEQAKYQDEVAKGSVIAPKKGEYQVELELADGTRYPFKGFPSFADPSFNRETGTFLIRAELPNPKAVLKPGMFVKAHLQGMIRPNRIVIPQKAVQQTSNGHAVFVVNDNGTASVRPVVAGEWLGQDWIINDGLKAGDKVVVDGFQKLIPGAPVTMAAAAAGAAKGADNAAKAAAAPPAKGADNGAKPAAPPAKGADNGAKPADNGAKAVPPAAKAAEATPRGLQGVKPVGTPPKDAAAPKGSGGAKPAGKK